jgi:hypothetical protein
MANRNGNPLIDAQTTLVGWTNRSATRPEPHTYLSGEEVLLSTKLDAAARFSLIVSSPGSDAPTEVQLYLAPVLRDGSRGHWIPVLTVALPKEGGRVEAFLSGHDIALDPADLASVLLPAVCFAKAEVSPMRVEGMHVGLTATIPA